MSDMTIYSIAMLSAIADFLTASPFIEILGFIILAIVAKVVISIINIARC